MRIPDSTYRFQFTSEFNFKRAKELITYLNNLGITDIYASPILNPVTGSNHGYDVVDPTKINPELGSEEDFLELLENLEKHDIGWIQDLVPNHMAYHSENKMLMDIFESGENSIYRDFFDINWDYHFEDVKGKILAPFIGKFYGEALESCEIRMSYEEKGMYINYYTLKFPLKMETYLMPLKHKFNSLKNKMGTKNQDFIKFLGVLYVIQDLSKDISERTDQISFIQGMLWELYTTNEDIKNFIDGNIEIFNGVRGNHESFDLLDELLSKQVFRLAFWKVGSEEINYRRFFNVNGLISLKIEIDKVFDYTHDYFCKFAREGKISGFRIDHIDGLYAPTEYLKKLINKAGNIYILVEKILESQEELPEFWVAQGTTGYDSLNYINSVFVNTKNEEKMKKIYSKFVGRKIEHDDMLYRKKKLIIEKHMTSDVENLTYLLKKILVNYRHGKDVTFHSLKRVMIEIMANFPVYRTYLDYDIYTGEDRDIIEKTIEKVMEYNPDLIYELNLMIWFFRRGDYISGEEKEKWLYFIMKFQQMTGPLMAKGYEDTVFYIYNNLISLNEVGGNPGKFGITINEFNEFNERKMKKSPYSMNASSTHDTKRSEDIRARINVLSEIPDEWEKYINQFKKFNKNENKIPDNNDEYFFYQSLIGAFPFEDKLDDEFVSRIKEYAIKAVREAKVYTGWIKPDNNYENNYEDFIERILTKENEKFLKVFYEIKNKVAYYGMYNSLSQLILKIGMPGVPDFYQGTELWNFRFVDPDNRKEVDYDTRKKYLKEIKAEYKKDTTKLTQNLLKNMEDGKIKLYITYLSLQYRKEYSFLFKNSLYSRVNVSGAYKENIISFGRNYLNDTAVFAVPRFLSELIKPNEIPIGNVWKDTKLEIQNGTYENVFTGEKLEVTEDEIEISTLFKSFPFAFLIKKDTI